MIDWLLNFEWQMFHAYLTFDSHWKSMKTWEGTTNVAFSSWYNALTYFSLKNSLTYRKLDTPVTFPLWPTVRLSYYDMIAPIPLPRAAVCWDLEIATNTQENIINQYVCVLVYLLSSTREWCLTTLLWTQI